MVKAEMKLQMKRISILATLVLLLSNCGSSRQLTRGDAKKILDKVAAQTAITQITLNADQAKRLMSLVSGGYQASSSFDMEAGKPCLPDGDNARTVVSVTHRFVLCQGVISPDVTWQQPGYLLPSKHAVKWVLIEVTGITDSVQNEKIVEYTWEWDSSPFPSEIRDILRYSPSTGRALFRHYDDGWRFVEIK